jgi:hypothetical protein
MYVYIYDEFINSGRYDKALYKVEKKLTDLGLNGKTIRLGTTKNLKSAIDDEIRQGAKTIVAVGSDQTVAQVVNVIANNQSDEKYRLCLGIIPLEEKESHLAKIFGIKNLNDACEVLLGRRLETFKLASINNDFFLFSAKTETNNAILEIDKSFIIQPTKPAWLEIINNPKPTDNKKLLSLKIKEGDTESSFSFQDLLLVNKDVSIITDGAVSIKTPVKIFLSDEVIKIIVGKDRKI